MDNIEVSVKPSELVRVKRETYEELYEIVGDIAKVRRGKASADDAVRLLLNTYRAATAQTVQA